MSFLFALCPKIDYVIQVDGRTFHSTNRDYNQVNANSMFYCFITIINLALLSESSVLFGVDIFRMY